jgi:ribonuclease Z
MHNEHRFLVDCGEGTQRQILKSGIGFKRLNRILITHGHLDHILGLAGLLSTLMRWEAMDDLEVMAGPWALERIDDLLNGVVLRGKPSPIPLRLTPIRPGVIFTDRDFSVSAFPVQHRGPDCFGFVFEEQPRRPFLPEKADALGIPPGPWRRLLVDGLPAELPDGRTIQPDEVLGETRPGTRLVHIGDLGRTDGLAEVCCEADTLVIEATYLEAETAMARDFAHLTALDAARFAREAGVKNLVLTHLSRRYRERDVYAEAQSVFPGTIVARDFDHFQIKRGEITRIEQTG